MGLKNRINANITEESCLKKRPPFPKKNMLIELNNHCNHKCLFCANRKMERRKGYIKEEFLIKILKDAFSQGVIEVGYYSTGEPFLHPNLARYIKIAKDIGYKYIYLTTNGGLANIDKVRQCIESGLDSIKFSINGYDDRSYTFIHGVNDFDTVIKNIKATSNYRKDNNLNFKIYTSTILTSFTAKAESILKELLNSYVDEMVFLNVINQGGAISDIIDELYVTKETNRVVKCFRPFNSIHITHEGFLTACCVDFNNYLAVADLNEMTLIEAWESDQFTEFRENFLKNNLTDTLCYNCFNNTTNVFAPLNDKFSTNIDLDKLYNDNVIVDRMNL